jgi:TDG/mug DNA glycosylase family protein
MSTGPTRAELMQAADRRVPDVIAPGLTVLFCGNPGLYSAWAGHHFARPGNRFWPTLHAAGFTPRRLVPAEERALLEQGYGVTNIVPRATAAAAQLAPGELAEGARRLEAKVRRFSPRAVAVLGIGAYRSAFGRPRAGLGRQPDGIGGALAWVLPNPSGLNASYRPADLARLFAELRNSVVGPDAAGVSRSP